MTRAWLAANWLVPEPWAGSRSTPTRVTRGASRGAHPRQAQINRARGFVLPDRRDFNVRGPRAASGKRRQHAVSGIDQRRGVVGSAISVRRNFPEEIGIHDPALLLFGFASDLLNFVHELPQIPRHEDLVFSFDVGTPVDLDLWVVDVLERTF